MNKKHKKKIYVSLLVKKLHSIFWANKLNELIKRVLIEENLLVLFFTLWLGAHFVIYIVPLSRIWLLSCKLLCWPLYVEICKVGAKKKIFFFVCISYSSAHREERYHSIIINNLGQKYFFITIFSSFVFLFCLKPIFSFSSLLIHSQLVILYCDLQFFFFFGYWNFNVVV